MFPEGKLNYPEWDESVSDRAIISEFYDQLLKRYPEVREDIEFNEGLLHLDMASLQRVAEKLCKERKLAELESCFLWVNSLFCRSRNELLNAINVSFLECFLYSPYLSKQEFKNAMPPELYQGYEEIMSYIEELGKQSISQ
ncbi:hypothetical protein ACCH70_004324 [Vibrio vulnificus]|uniref:DUF7674 family protein n=1 Tax=Vibrio vulnificus TaxID=672 RepID=UPI0004487D1C|nr:hypothetical protein [Vibrio vulnificus]EIT7127110.1 hypothetical protein [Vibrio parahaemolyticus]EJL6590193.1 hypothetical protein [Vibrio cholerae]EWS67131.1 hypothetical protein Y702_22655 [Vibrio vulnificus BAA87]EGQ7936572.1 hypothetical protein [Vibrio vulnificus]